MAPGTEKYVLQTDGKFLTVQKHRDGLHLYAVDRQIEQKAPIVYISTRNVGIVKQVAFRFKRGESSYSLKVDGSVLKLENTVNYNTALPESHWFEKKSVDGSVRYILHSVVVPSQSLSLDSHKRFILSDDPAPITEKTVP